MKLELLFLGKTKAPYLQEGIDDFAGRLRHYCNLALTILKVKKKKGGSGEQEKKEEGRLLLDNVDPGTVKVVLDAGGRSLSSEGLAEQISRWQNQGVKQVSFLIGGPLGLSDEVISRADLLLSLSRMTLTHDMARLILMEQLYRAYTIKAGEKYHK
ncbi:MAG: 23S rRNA (pseudouridine(1915)-N(3))-methyltransferase RlmH [Thermodesulfobacteriota bacterium]